MKHIKIFILLLFTPTIQADTIVKLEVKQGIKTENIYIRLFEDTTPNTVMNFLNYSNNTTVNGGNYNNMFFHRLVPDFVLQGGGFTFDLALNDGSFSYDPVSMAYNGGLQNITPDVPVANEFSRSNTYGTVAMAKVAGSENSATSEWFVNLADNSANLDFQNGGFTVFGEVLESGMNIFEEINNLTVYDRSLHTPSLSTDVHPAFSSLPLVGYISDPIQQSNLVSINSIVELVSITSDLDFGLHLLSAKPTLDVIITNKSNINLIIGDIGNNNILLSPFSIISDNCTYTTLTPLGSCTITVEFSVLSEGTVTESFNIELTNIPHNYTVSIKGEGASIIAPDVSLSETVIDFNEQPIYDPEGGIPEIIELQVNNDGNAELIVSSVTLDGLDLLEFELFDNCTMFSPITRGDLCRLFIHFKPLSTGTKNATLTIITNDSDEGVIIVPVTGTASIDVDGVAVAIEDAASNNGDANFDGILDSIQSDVASFINLNGSYTTIKCSQDKEIRKLTVYSNSELPPLPDGASSDLGTFNFIIDDVISNSIIEVGFVQQQPFDTIYLYGPTVNNTNPHWYQLDNSIDPLTGTAIYGKSTLISQSGEKFERYVAKIRVREGGMGDTYLNSNDEALIFVALVNRNSNKDTDTGTGTVDIKLILLLLINYSFFKIFLKQRKY